MLVILLAIFSWGIIIVIPKDISAIESLVKDMNKSMSAQEQKLTQQFSIPGGTEQGQGGLMNLFSQGLSGMTSMSPGADGPTNTEQSFSMQTPSIQSSIQSFMPGQGQSGTSGDMFSSMMPDISSFTPSAIMGSMGWNGGNSVNMSMSGSEERSYQQSMPPSEFSNPPAISRMDQ